MAHVIRTLGPIKEKEGQHGSLRIYAVQFEGSDDWVDIAQMATSTPPKVGMSLEGTITDTKYGKKFERAKSGSFSGQTRSAGKSAEEIVSIQRQVALKAAVETVRDFYAAERTIQATPLSVDLRGYVNQVINAATAFERHLETGAPAQVDIKPSDSLDAAIIALGGEEVPYEEPQV